MKKHTSIHKNLKHNSLSSGFTLVELMVAISILTLFIVSFYGGSNSNFQDRSHMRTDIVNIMNLYSNARSMAINSVSLTEDGGTQAVVPQNGYGVFADFDLPAGANGVQFVLFADFDESGAYTTGGTEDIESITVFDSGVYLNTQVFGIVEGVDPDGDEISPPHSFGKSGDDLTILFAPLTADPTILLDNDINNTNVYSGLIMEFVLPGILEENITFQVISRFFTREFISADPSPTP